MQRLVASGIDGAALAVESAQQRIVDIVRRLEEAGEIIIAGRGGQEELIV